MTLYELGLYDYEIAYIVGRTPSAITLWRHRRQLPPNGRRGRLGNGLKGLPRPPGMPSLVWEKHMDAKALEVYLSHPEWSIDEVIYEVLRCYLNIPENWNVIFDEGEYNRRVRCRLWGLFERVELYRNGELVERRLRLLPGKVSWWLRRRVRTVVGFYLRERCRELDGCSLIPLLPEYRSPRDEEGNKNG